MVHITHRIGIKAPAARVYDALASLEGLSRWWTDEVGGSGEVGGAIDFTFRKRTGELLGGFRMEVTALEPGRAVRWRCVDGPPEWIGTGIDFALSGSDGQTIVLFAHRDWREEVEFMAHCSMKWATFLLSLRDYVETGTGAPSPDDVKIDDWN